MLKYVGMIIEKVGDVLVYSNLHNTLKLFGSLEGVRSEEFKGKILLSDNGVDSEYENYALVNPSLDCSCEEGCLLVNDALEFFAETGRPHIWPIFPGVPEHLTDKLEELGIKSNAVFYAMKADIDSVLNLTADSGQESEIIKITSVSEAHEWADAAWYGFDSDEPAPESFLEFVREASNHKDILLVALRPPSRTGHRMAATGMLTLTEGEAGIYYISTLPDFRKRGFAAEVMKSLVLHASELGYKKTALLATPDGRDFYKRIGFSIMHKVDIRVCLPKAAQQN